MCTDTSSYLKDHQFFACTDDTVDPAVSEILGEASDLGRAAIYDAVAWIAKKIWKSKSEDIDLQVVMAQSVLASQGSGAQGAKGKQALTANSSKATVEDEAEDDSDYDHVDDYIDDEYFNIKPKDSAAETAMKLALKQ